MGRPLQPSTSRQLDAIAARPTGTYIFVDNGLTGAYEAATELARRLHCGMQANCRECHQIELGSYPDLLIIRPEEKQSIGIAQAKKLVSDLSFRRYTEKGHRIVIISPADKMTPEAQNSLLKTLEELPEFTQVFLLVQSPDRLLETVRSRSKIVYFTDNTTSDDALSQLVQSLPNLSSFQRLTTAANLGETGFDTDSFVASFTKYLAQATREAVDANDNQRLSALTSQITALEKFTQWMSANVPPKTALSGLLLAL